MSNLHRLQFGNLGAEAHPVPVTHDAAQDNATIDRMAGRIVQTYQAAPPQNHAVGERFYSHDANGAARSIANGQDPNSHLGKFDRSIPAPESRGPGSTNPSWGHSAANQPLSRSREDFEGRLHRASGAIAQLSPQTEWETNVRQAHEAHHLPETATGALGRLQRGDLDPSRKPNKQGKLQRYEVHDDAGQKMALNKQPSASILKAHEIAQGFSAPEATVASGPDDRVKIGSFMHNVEHPQTSPHTTVDFRAHDIATGTLRATSEPREISKSGKPPREGKAPSKAYDSRQRYLMIEEAHNRATDHINEHLPHLRQQEAPLQPKQVQAVTWWADKDSQDAQMGGVAKGGHLHAGKGGKALGREALGKPVGQ